MTLVTSRALWDAPAIEQDWRFHLGVKLLKTQVETISKKLKCSMEIRAGEGPLALRDAQRLQKVLGAAGFAAEIVIRPVRPTDGLLIETSHATAESALALQSAFLGAGIEAELLVHEKAQPKTVVLHLGEC